MLRYGVAFANLFTFLLPSWLNSQATQIHPPTASDYQRWKRGRLAPSYSYWGPKLIGPGELEKSDLDQREDADFDAFLM